MAKMMKLNSEERHEGLMLRVVLQSNIVPRGSFLERLEELELHWLLFNLRLVLMGTYYVSKRGFFPKSILDQACEARNASLMEKVNEWRKENKGRCCLAEHLEARLDDDPECVTPLTPLREIPVAEVEEIMLLGKGGEASVHQVLWRNRTYAKKKWRSGTDFDKELKVAFRVVHPNIAAACGWSDKDVDDNGEPVHCLLMELMTEDLSRLAVKRDVQTYSAVLSRVDSLHVLLQVAIAIDYMHTKNVVHGDLKPDNILITFIEVSENERYLLAKVADFGCAQFFSPGQTLRIPGAIGTNEYSAPEVLSMQYHLGARKDFQYPEKMDVYSFGAVAYEVLTGHKIRYGDRDYVNKDDKKMIINGDLRLRNSREWKHMIKDHRYPLELIELVEKCLELHPEDTPTFHDILSTIRNCKSTVVWEQRAAAIWKILVLGLLLFALVALSSYMRFL